MHQEGFVCSCKHTAREKKGGSKEEARRKELKRLVTLECVRNKDRMAVEPIVLLTRKTCIGHS